MNIASDTCVWTGGSPFESKGGAEQLHLCGPGLDLLAFFSPVLELNMAKLTREVIRFRQVPPHRKWLGLCSGLLGTTTLILQGLRPAELTTG